MSYTFENTKVGSASKPQRKSNRDYKPARKTVNPAEAIAKAKEAEKAEWLRYLKRTQPEKVYTLDEQIVYVTRKISAVELSVEKPTAYTRYKIAYLDGLRSKKILADLNAKNMAGARTTLADIVISK